MDVFELVVRSEWPIVVVLAGLVFRKRIAAMLDRISPTKIDAWGFKAEFARVLDKIDALTAPSEEEAEIQRVAQKPHVSEKRSPEGLILTSWQRVEDALTDVLRGRIDDLALKQPWTTPEEAVRRLGLSDDGVQAIRQLRELRNDVAHGRIESISEEEAERFDDITWRLIARLASLPPKEPQDR